MTIQQLHTYAGRSPGVYTLGSTEEARLIGLGLARDYTPGMDGKNPVLSNAEQAALQSSVSAYGNSGALFCDWQSGSGILSLVSSNGGGEAVALDPSWMCDGLPMVVCTMGNAGTFIADFLFTAPAYLAQMQSFQVPIRCEDNSVLTGAANSAQIWLWDDAIGTRQWRLTSSNRSLDLSQMRSGVNNVLSFSPGTATEGWSFGGASAPTSTTDLDAYTVYRVRIVFVTPAGAVGKRIGFGPLRYNGRNKPVISLMLDGQYSSQHNYLLPMIEAQGLTCSIAIQGNQIGQSGRMTRTQLDRAYAAGHEIIHHTYDGTKGNGYQDSGQWADAAAITADINANWALMQSYGWTRGIGYMVHGGSVHPFNGASVSLARQAIVASAMAAAAVKAARTGTGAATLPLNRLQSMARVQNVDPFSIQGALQWTSTDNAASLTAVVTRAKAKGEWGIITGHRSVVSGASSLEILNSDFLTFIQSLGDDARSGKLAVKPFGDAARYYGLTT